MQLSVSIVHSWPIIDVFVCLPLDICISSSLRQFCWPWIKDGYTVNGPLGIVSMKSFYPHLSAVFATQPVFNLGLWRAWELSFKNHIILKRLDWLDSCLGWKTIDVLFYSPKSFPSERSDIMASIFAVPQSALWHVGIFLTLKCVFPSIWLCLVVILCI